MTHDAPLDDHYLALTALVTVGMQLFFFFIAASLRFDKVTDLAGSSNFLLLALLTLLDHGSFTTRQVLVTVLVCVWAVRLGAYLLYRVLRRGKDERFDEIRDSFFKFLFFWIFQMLWVWIVSLPVIYLNSIDVDPEFGTAADVVGLVLWIIGFLVEVEADRSKDAFNRDPANKGKFLASSVWAWSRHPNYFGEIVIWLGVFLMASSVFGEPGVTSHAYASVVSPLFTFVLLMFMSGVPPAEERYTKKFGHLPEYRDYVDRTSLLVPLPPALYSALPSAFKCLVCFEWPFYVRPRADQVAGDSAPLQRAAQGGGAGGGAGGDAGAGGGAGGDGSGGQ
jgi:steroid 5-alpha reductase family enzyme